MSFEECMFALALLTVGFQIGYAVARHEHRGTNNESR